MCKQAELDALLDEATRLAGAGNLKTTSLTLIAAIRLLAEKGQGCRCGGNRAEEPVAPTAAPVEEPISGSDTITQIAPAAPEALVDEGLSEPEPTVILPLATSLGDSVAGEDKVTSIEAMKRGRGRPPKAKE